MAVLSNDPAELGSIPEGILKHAVRQRLLFRNVIITCSYTKCLKVISELCSSYLQNG